MAWSDVRRNAPSLATFAIGYGALYALSLRLGQPSAITPIWPPAGVLLAALLLLPDLPRWWLIATAFVVGRFASPNGFVPSLDRLVLLLAGYAEALVAATLITRWRGVGIRFNRLKDVVALTAAALIAVTTNGLISGGLALAAQRPFADDFVAAWIGGFLGMILVTPLLVSWVHGTDDLHDAASIRQLMPEGAALLVILAVHTTLIFRNAVLVGSTVLPAYTLLVTVLWIALRLGVRGTTTAAVVITVIAITGVLAWGSTTLGGGTIDQRLFAAQLYIAFMSIYGLVLAIALGERRAAYRSERRATEALLESERRLQQSQKMQAIGLLAGGVAHDFNNLLTVISSSVELLHQSGEPAERHALATEANKAVERGQRLTASLLAFGREQPLDPIAVDIDAELARMEPFLRRLAGSTVPVRMELEGRARVLLSPSALDQLLINLVSNARDAMPKGGTITIASHRVPGVSTGAERDMKGDRVEIAVTDTGSGMCAESVQRAFDPYFTTKPLGFGNGLGLASVYALVQRANGHISIDSEPGRGTSIRMDFPIVHDMRSVAQTMMVSPAVPQDMPTKRTVELALVDDDDAVRRTLAALLRRQGFRVREYSAGEQILAGLDGGTLSCDLLVSDVRMPGMNGVDLAFAVRSRRPELPVLLVSGYVDDTELLDRLRPAGIPLLSKPVRSDSLLGTIHTLVDGTRAPIS